ncbi:MAG: bifunctional riboflavin kinase/FMN adenylyltransferase, partial [Bacilli bacterium]|nr:bifunctional riboflavin kinase/FMN adenylyltransferase [Bacilli bacterium]
MEIIEFNYQETPRCPDSIALCLGFFDAIHLGHQAIIAK